MTQSACSVSIHYHYCLCVFSLYVYSCFAGVFIQTVVCMLVCMYAFSVWAYGHSELAHSMNKLIAFLGRTSKTAAL